MSLNQDGRKLKRRLYMQNRQKRMTLKIIASSLGIKVRKKEQ